MPIELKPKLYRIVAQCVENGLSRGYMWAYKYEDDPPKDFIVSAMKKAIMAELSDVFYFGDDDD